MNNLTKSKEKLLGQFFTPRPIARAMAAWVMSGKAERILDPAVGSGLLLEAILEIEPETSIVGFDIDPEMIVRARTVLKPSAELHVDNYLESVFESKFDGIIANPPYIRHHDFCADPSHFQKGLFGKLSKLTNIYILFISKILSDLGDGGRAAVLVPSDWTTANFGAPFRKFLTQTSYLKKLVLFDSNGQVFDDNLSTGSLLLFEKKEKLHVSVEVALVNADKSSKSVGDLENRRIDALASAVFREVDLSKLDPDSKWLSSLSDSGAEAPNDFISLGTLARSKRGIATGANAFFHVSAATQESMAPNASFRKCVGRAKDVPGLVFSSVDLTNLEKSDAPSRLLDLDKDRDQEYLEIGLTQKISERYLLKSRRNWYDQEVRTPASIWVGVFSRGGTRFILNESGAHNLTSFHGIYTDLTQEQNRALVALLNSPALQEINRRHLRSYGGGLSKLEPRDILELKIPDVRYLHHQDLEYLGKRLYLADRYLRQGKEGWRLALKDCY